MKHLREGQPLTEPQRASVLRPEAAAFVAATPSQRADMDIPFSPRAMSVLGLIAFVLSIPQYAMMDHTTVALRFAERYGITEEVAV